MLRRYPSEVRNAAEYFDDIKDVKITKDMLELAEHIVEQKFGRFEPEHLKTTTSRLCQQLLDQTRKGLPIAAPEAGTEQCVLFDGRIEAKHRGRRQS